MSRLSDLRVGDKVLNNVLKGYASQTDRFVGFSLFPEVSSSVRAGKYALFSDDHFSSLDPDDLLTPLRTEGKRVNFDLDVYEIECKDYSEQSSIDEREIEESGSYLKLANTTVKKLQSRIMTGIEVLQANTSTDTSNYTSGNYVVPTTKWDDSSIDVIEEVDKIKDIISQKVGVLPNTMIIGEAVWTAIKRKTEFVDSIKYSQKAAITPDILGTLFDIENVYIGRGVYKDKSGTTQSIWGKNIVIAYVDKATKDPFAPNYGYTFRKKGYPMVKRYNEGARQIVFDVMDSVGVYLVGMPAGYLVSAAIT